MDARLDDGSLFRSALRPLNRAVMFARVLPIAQCGPSLVPRRRQPTSATNFVDAVVRRPLTRWATEKASDSAVVVPVRALDNLARNKKSRDGRFDWPMGVGGLRVRRLRRGGGTECATRSIRPISGPKGGPLEGSACSLVSGSPQTRSLRESEAAMRHVARWSESYLMKIGRTKPGFACGPKVRRRMRVWRGSRGSVEERLKERIDGRAGDSRRPVGWPQLLLERGAQGPRALGCSTA